MPGEILVKFKPAVGQLSAQRALAVQGLKVADAIPSIAVLKVSVEPGRELETIAALRRDPNVLYAEPNYIAHALDTNPNDTYYNPPYSYQWGLSKINAPAAWDITTGSSDVVIAIVDTGIDLDHPDLSCPGKLWVNPGEIPGNSLDDDGNGYIDDVNGWNFVNTSLPPDDDNSHGSHVAGIAAACTNNGTGVAGVAWGARLMPVKVLNYAGNGSYAGVAAGITYAVNNGADIINLSLGGFDPSGTLEDAIQHAYDHNVLVVAAAGNCAQDGWQCNYLPNPIVYPAAYSTTLAVAATDSGDGWASFSEYRDYVDVAAPGVGIYSTVPVPGSYGYKSGTSMATPHVAGLAALVWSFAPGLSRDQVGSIIQSTADDLGDPGWDDYFGYGRINARRALEMASLRTSPAQAFFLIDDDSGPFPASNGIQVTTTSPNIITWTTVISPDDGWLSIVPPVSGTVSVASSDGFTLVATRPVTYGMYTTTVVVTGTTSSGGQAGPATTEVRISYLADLYQYIFPIMYKNYAP